MKRYCLALDLKDDPILKEEYINHHKKVWPEILDSILNSGIRDMQIYNIENRLFMIMDVEDYFSFEKKDKLDAENPFVQKWEALMSTYQQKLPSASPHQKWVLMNKIFQL